jgi:hypothetical protein
MIFFFLKEKKIFIKKKKKNLKKENLNKRKMKKGLFWIFCIVLLI